MPRKDGTGPMGKGPIGGNRPGMGRGSRGRMSGNMAAGPGGYCICPNCGEKVLHQLRTPCTSVPCPKCGTMMIRE